MTDIIGYIIRHKETKVPHGTGSSLTIQTPKLYRRAGTAKTALKVSSVSGYGIPRYDPDEYEVVPVGVIDD